MLKNLSLVFLLLISCQIHSREDEIVNDIEVLNIENPALQAFMADSTYFKNDDYRISVIAKYANKNVYGADLDAPQGKYVSWNTTTPLDSIAEIRVTTSQHRDYTDSITTQPNKLKDGYCAVYNLIPSRIYYYKVEEFLHNGNVNQLGEGSFRTTGQVRMIRARGAHNMRDIGGWPTSFGVPIKYGKLYRSGNLDAVQPSGVHELVDNLRLGAELDLRSESKLKESRLGEKVDFIRIITDSYIGAIQSKSQSYAHDLQWIIARLRDGKNVDWHCAVGCDRCGTVSFLIEGLLGVSEVDLCRDYELSTLRGHKRYRTTGAFNKMITWMKKQGPADDLAQCFYNYFVNAGVPAVDLDFLRSEMLDYPAASLPAKHWWDDLPPAILHQ